MPFVLGGWYLDNFSTQIFDMSKQLTDCYYYYYSKCTKAECGYRHEPSARGHEIICNRWLEDNCFDVHCPNRHFHITKQRSKIPCYFETTPNGCTKPHCVFLHSKPKNNNSSGQPNLNGPTTTPPQHQHHSTAEEDISAQNDDDSAIGEMTASVQNLDIAPIMSSFRSSGEEQLSHLPEGTTAGNNTSSDQTLDSSGINSICEEDLLNNS